MRYQGSKYSMRKVLKSIIEPLINEESTCYVEPFAGGCNSLAYIDCKNKIACDCNKYVIALWNGIKNNTFTIPDYVSYEEYNSVKDDWKNNRGRYSDAYIGYVSFCCSYGSGFWNGYAKYNPKKNEDHIIEARNGILKQIASFKYLDKTVFLCRSFEDIDFAGNDIVFYCDPPYCDTKKYEKTFDSQKFWQWCRNRVNEGHKVIVSEYKAPDDFVEIWSKKMQDGMKMGNGTKVEKIFVHKSQVKLFKTEVQVSHEVQDIDKNEYVDLGLPSGTLWAKCNVGAKKPEEYGDYFMWGSVTPDTADPCDWSHAPFNNGSLFYYKTYFNSVKDTVCPNGVLAPEYDAVHQIMGGDWHMPTKKQIQELVNNTDIRWIKDWEGTGVNGRVFTSRVNGNSIFIPASGFRDDSSVYGRGTYANVWSSSLDASSPYGAWDLYSYSSDCNVSLSGRCNGFSLRGVINRK